MSSFNSPSSSTPRNQSRAQVKQTSRGVQRGPPQYRASSSSYASWRGVKSQANSSFKE